MRSLVLAAIAFLIATCFADTSLAHGSSSGGVVSVHGYFRKDGTYVAPYYRTAPDSTKLNNWSTIGNVNPYTGKPGTVNPYPEGTSVPAADSAVQAMPLSSTQLVPLGAQGIAAPTVDASPPTDAAKPAATQPTLVGDMANAVPSPTSTTVQGLYAECKAGVDTAEGRRPYSVEAGNCLEYMQGYWGAASVFQAASGVSTVCMPSDMTYLKEVRVFLRYVDAHPHVISKTPEAVLWVALATNFPCRNSVAGK